MDILYHQAIKNHLDGKCVSGSIKDQYISRVEIATGVPFKDIKGKSRFTEVVEARQLLCYFLRSNTKMFLWEIGRLINRDHSTVSVSVQKIHDFLKQGDERITSLIKLVKDYGG